MSNDTIDTNYSNFVTPPDFVTDQFHTVTLVDASWDDIETLATYCKSCSQSFNVYLFNEVNSDYKWLADAISKSDVVIINTDSTDLSLIKDKLVIADNAYYYGAKNFLMNSKRIEQPIDYFIKHMNQD